MGAVDVPLKPAVLANLKSTNSYKGTWLIRNRAPLGPYGRTMPRTLWEGVFLMSEVPL